MLTAQQLSLRFTKDIKTCAPFLNFDKFDTYDDLEAFREEIDSDEISLENDFLLNESKNIIVDYLKFSSQLIAVNQN